MNNEKINIFFENLFKFLSLLVLSNLLFCFLKTQDFFFFINYTLSTKDNFFFFYTFRINLMLAILFFENISSSEKV